jgi:hypothetical protein
MKAQSGYPGWKHIEIGLVVRTIPSLRPPLGAGMSAHAHRRVAIRMPISTMPFMNQSLEFRSSHVLTVVSGWITVEGITGLLEEILEHESFRPGMGLLWDVRQMEGLGEFSAEDLREVIEIVIERLPRRGGGPSAYLVMRDVDYGVARMFEQIADPNLPILIRVFRDMDAARAWVEEPTSVSGPEPSPGADGV